MSAVLSIAEVPREVAPSAYEATLDLAALAEIARGEPVLVDDLPDRTQELFQHTLRIVDSQPARQDAPSNTEPRPRRHDFVPEHADLRQRFLFAETVGSYSALHDLLNGYSPAYQLFASYEQRMRAARLTEQEVRILEAYRAQVDGAVVHANHYLLENLADGFSGEELRELNEILREARDRCERATALLGMNLIHGVERAVCALEGLYRKTQSVHPSLDGTFLVDSEVMFIPTADLIKIVNALFAAIGNPYVARHVDGLLLLAARNLLIKVVSFYSYYGRQQIYNVIRRRATTVNRAAIVHHIRAEIRELFKACRAENRLILRRVMATAEQQFEISVEALRRDAEASALEVVDRLLPPDPGNAEPPERPTLLQRLANWLFRS